MLFFLFGAEIKREVCLECGLEYGVGSGVMEGGGECFRERGQNPIRNGLERGLEVHFFPVHIICFCFLK